LDGAHRVALGRNGGNELYYWTAPAASSMSADVITATCSAGWSFDPMIAYGIAGYKTSSPFDCGGLQSLQGDPVSITTANNFTILIGAFSTNTSNTTAGSGFTQLGRTSGDFVMFEYKIVTTSGAQSVTVGTGAGSTHIGVADAIVSR
jgi:hypothetical protein